MMILSLCKNCAILAAYVERREAKRASLTVKHFVRMMSAQHSLKLI